MNDPRLIRTTLLAIGLGATLSGCSFFHSREPDYKASGEAKPLEVPPDLDRPSGSSALVVPDRGSASASSASSSSSLASAPSDVAPAAGVGATLGGDGLHVADSVDSTWSRVGLALERSGAATIESRDASGFSYEITATTETTVKRGFLNRMAHLGRNGKEKTTVRMTVRVVPDGQGSKVVIEGAAGADNAARSVLETLRQRLA